jgi:hypothetical protein
LPASPQGPRKLRHARWPQTVEGGRLGRYACSPSLSRRLAGAGPDARVSSRGESLLGGAADARICCPTAVLAVRRWTVPARRRRSAAGASLWPSAKPPATPDRALDGLQGRLLRLMGK